MKSEQSNTAILKELGERFKQQRAARNIDQAALAYESGVAQRTLSRLENGHATSFEAVIKVMRALDLLERLDLMLPASDVSPVQIIKHKQSKPRQRARSTGKPAGKADWQGFAQPVVFDEEGEA